MRVHAYVCAGCGCGLMQSEVTGGGGGGGEGGQGGALCLHFQQVEYAVKI